MKLHHGNKLSPTHRLFFPSVSSSLLDHLSLTASPHGFFTPDADYLFDLPGLVTYMGKEIALGNECFYCNGRAREFHSLHAVRKHDK
jgi:pre-60S factor REI1